MCMIDKYSDYLIINQRRYAINDLNDLNFILNLMNRRVVSWLKALFDFKILF